MNAVLMAAAKTIQVELSSALHQWCGGAPRLSVSASDLRSLLDQLEVSHPDLHRGICDETGAVRRHVNIFVNVSHVRDREGLDTILADGDVVTIAPALSGG